MSAPGSMHPINLECEVCGWRVHALLGGSNGTTAQRARAELIARLHWAPNGRRCDHCKDSGPRPGRSDLFAGCLQESPA